MAVIKKKKDSFKTLFDKNLEQFHHVTVILPCPYQLINQLSAEDNHLRFQKIFLCDDSCPLRSQGCHYYTSALLINGADKGQKILICIHIAKPF